MKNFLSTTTGKIAAVAVSVLVIVGIVLLATSGAGAANSDRGIGLDKSIAVALADAGLKEDQVNNLQGHFEKDDGLDAYDVSFLANNYEYEYTIKASDGAILECKIESPEGLQVTAQEALDIGQDKALAAALTHAGLKKSDVEITKSRKGYDDGAIVYEFDFVKDNVEYEYDIDGTTGGVIEFSREVLNKQTSTSADGNSGQAGSGTMNTTDSGSSGSTATDSGKTSTSGTTGNSGKTSTSGSSGSASTATDSGKASSSGSADTSSYIGVDKAKTIALENAGIKAADATFTTAKLDRDDGRYVYEIDFYAGDYEYDYEIDATNGTILERDSEPLDDWDDDWDD